MANTLTGLIPTIFTALDTVSREQVGFIPAVSRNAKADAAAKDQTVTAPVAPPATTVDITPGATAPNDGDQTIGTVDVKITKSKMAPVKWNGEEQLALGPAGTYNTILADQFKQAFRALANEMDADLAALYYASSRAVGTAGTAPFGIAGDLSDAANARQVLSDNGSPTTDLQMVLGSSAIANLRGKQSVLFKVNESGIEPPRLVFCSSTRSVYDAIFEEIAPQADGTCQVTTRQYSDIFYQYDDAPYPGSVS